jgi:secondary thiamine-phosphate synthase enzyme
MKVIQKSLVIPAKKRGFHLITAEVNNSISKDLQMIKHGICHVFIQHTSASLTINENADSSVRKDFETYFNKAVPEGQPDFLHDTEGPDDMPAHIKSSLLGSSVSVPVTNGKLNLGTWQGIYLCEHRDYGGDRRIVITVMGE